MGELNNNVTTTEAFHESGSTIYLTPGGYTRLQQELEHLTVVKRPEIADRIRESQQHGEFSEDNSELDEVKFEQAMVETRIAELKTILSNAQPLDMDLVPTDRVGIGSLVTVRDLDWDDQFEVRLVTSVEADPTHDLVSNEAPMGLAIFGRSSEEDVTFEAPEGKKRYRIVRIAR
jgi:transcription elongation factor GreA